MMKNDKRRILCLICVAAAAVLIYFAGSSLTVTKTISAETENLTDVTTDNPSAEVTESLAGTVTGTGSDTYTENESNAETASDTPEQTSSGKGGSSVTDPESLINMNAAYPYKIYVNRILNRVVVYGIDYNGDYSVPYKGFICSVGAEGHETPLGTFSISDKYKWREMVDGSYAQYATRIYKGIMFHSVPYFSPSNDDLETAEYNKLGAAASLGCIRLTAADVKWIYDNCPKGTKVIIYDDEDEIFPIDFEDVVKIPTDDEYSGWDPTDPNAGNPWKTTQINNIAEN